MRKTPFGIRILYSLTKTVYYIVTLFVSIKIVLAIGLLFGFWSESTSLYSELPFEADFKEIGEVLFMGREMKVEFVESVGKLHFIDSPRIIERFRAILWLVLMPFVFYQVHLFYLFISNVKGGRIFDAENFYLLRKLSYVLMVMWIFRIVYSQILKYIVFDGLKFDGIEFSSIPDPYFGALIIALFTWVLSYIFLTGIELKEENELTV